MIRDAKETDSTLMKSLFFIKEERYKILSITHIEIVATVIGFHSSDITDYDDTLNEKVPYTVVIRRNGEHTCTCLHFVHAKKEYRQFWGELPIRSTPECSHVMAIKLLPEYIVWIIDDDDYAREVVQRPLYIKSYVRTSGVNIPPAMPTDLSKIDPQRKKRMVNFEDILKEWNS